MKTHLEKPNADKVPVCGALRGFYAPQKLTTVKAQVTCGRCLERIRKGAV